ncbi:MAG: hypothetical protein JWN25_2980 [Verrucomicrobiales bacterium]|nr:hypothetical protein [Verrucomicrobiales bacterium]
MITFRTIQAGMTSKSTKSKKAKTPKSKITKSKPTTKELIEKAQFVVVLLDGVKQLIELFS